MPLGAISPGDPSWRKASRYDRTAGRQVNTLEGHRPDARTPAADIETISLQKIVRTAALGIRFLRVEGVEPSSQPWEGHIIAVIRHPRCNND